MYTYEMHTYICIWIFTVIPHWVIITNVFSSHTSSWPGIWEFGVQDHLLSLSSRPALCVVSPPALKCCHSPQRQALHAGDAVPRRVHGGRQCGREERLRQWVLPGPPLLRLRLQHMHLFSTTLIARAGEAGRAACTGTGESSPFYKPGSGPFHQGEGSQASCRWYLCSFAFCPPTFPRKVLC